MDLNFLIPAATFVVVSALAMVLSQRRDNRSVSAPWTTRRFITMMIPGATAALLMWVAYRVLSTHFWPQDIPRSEENTVPVWAGISYFAAMLVGMAANAAFDAIGKRKEGTPPVFDPWSFLQPALVAPMVFLGVRGVLKDSAFTLEAILLAFQNGFFWQTVFEKLRRPGAGG